MGPSDLLDDQLPLMLLAGLLRRGSAASYHGLGRWLGCSPTEVSRAVATLEAHGCEMEHHPQHGVMLRRTGLPVWSDYLRWRHEGADGHRALVYHRTASTQAIGMRLARGAVRAERPVDVDGYVITADHQERGRGRLGARWRDEPGAQLLATLLAWMPEGNSEAVMLAVCNAAARTVEDLAGRRVGVKWPNDLLLDGGKVGGILVERVGEIYVIGIGINVHAAPSAEPGESVRPVALADFGVMVDRLRVLDDLLDHLHEPLRISVPEALAAEWRTRAVLMQQRVVAESDGRRLTGRVIDIDPREGLLLQVERGPVVALPAATTHIVEW